MDARLPHIKLGSMSDIQLDQTSRRRKQATVIEVNDENLKTQRIKVWSEDSNS